MFDPPLVTRDALHLHHRLLEAVAVGAAPAAPAPAPAPATFFQRQRGRIVSKEREVSAGRRIVSRSERSRREFRFLETEDSVGTAGAVWISRRPHQSPKNLFGRARSRGVAPTRAGEAARGVADVRARGARRAPPRAAAGPPRRARGVRAARGSARGGVVATRMSRRPRGEKKNALPGGVDASRALSRLPLGSRAVRGDREGHAPRALGASSPSESMDAPARGRRRRPALGADDEAVRAVRARREERPADDGFADDGRLGGRSAGAALAEADAHAGEGGGAGGHGRHRASANDVSRSRRSMRCDPGARATTAVAGIETRDETRITLNPFRRGGGSARSRASEPNAHMS